MFLVNGVVLLTVPVVLRESGRFHTRLTLSLILCLFIFLLSDLLSLSIFRLLVTLPPERQQPTASS